MNKIVSRLKNLQIGRVITVFLSALLLFVSTACSNNPKALANPGPQATRQEVPSGLQDVGVRGGENPRPEVPENAVTSPFQKGSMNEFSDVDPRMDTSKAQSKAKGLIDNAERNVIDQSSDVGENTKRILDKKGENARDFGQNLKGNSQGTADKAGGTAEDFAKGTKRGIENIKENTQDALTGAKKAADEAPKAVKSKVSSDLKNTRSALEGAADAVK